MYHTVRTYMYRIGYCTRFFCYLNFNRGWISILEEAVSSTYSKKSLTTKEAILVPIYGTGTQHPYTVHCTIVNSLQLAHCYLVRAGFSPFLIWYDKLDCLTGRGLFTYSYKNVWKPLLEGPRGWQFWFYWEFVARGKKLLFLSEGGGVGISLCRTHTKLYHVSVINSVSDEPTLCSRLYTSFHPLRQGYSCKLHIRCTRFGGSGPSWTGSGSD